VSRPSFGERYSLNDGTKPVEADRYLAKIRNLGGKMMSPFTGFFQRTSNLPGIYRLNAGEIEGKGGWNESRALGK